MARPTRILVPKTAKKGEVIEIKTIINHHMETGFRRDDVGRVIPRDIITRFRCTFGGEVVFAMELFTGIAANPFIAFTTVATESGELAFEWEDQNGEVTRATATISVA
ncbi:MAG: thiosulfate oxidation carrier complex protein SoxZ [Hyphomicrobiales bacterium]|nr:MAG: thiosulfate oxidation carrier complex protein SoxZ [Hyphomicrobiales bacterium]